MNGIQLWGVCNQLGSRTHEDKIGTGWLFCNVLLNIVNLIFRMPRFLKAAEGSTWLRIKDDFTFTYNVSLFIFFLSLEMLTTSYKSLVIEHNQIRSGHSFSVSIPH